MSNITDESDIKTSTKSPQNATGINTSNMSNITDERDIKTSTKSPENATGPNTSNSTTTTHAVNRTNLADSTNMASGPKDNLPSNSNPTTPSGNKTVFTAINKTPESNKTANDKPTNNDKPPNEMNVRNAIKGRYNVLPGPPAASAANDNDDVLPGQPAAPVTIDNYEVLPRPQPVQPANNTAPNPAAPTKPHPVPNPLDTPETPEEAHNRIIGVYKTESGANLMKWEGNKQDRVAQAHLTEATNNVFCGMSGHSDQWIQKHRSVVCEYILAKRNIVTAICEGTMTAKSIQELKNSFTQTALVVIVNLSAHSRELSKAICAIPGYIKFLYDILNDNSKTDTNDYNVQKLIIRVLMIIHNVAMTDSNIPILQEMKFTPLLHTFLSFTNDTIRMTAILAIADIMKEDESHYVGANSDVLDFLIQMFRRALYFTSRTVLDGHGMIWGVFKLAKGIGRLARNDGNKKILVEKGCLPLLLELARSTNQEEQKEALKSIWTLAFDETNQERIIQEPGMILFLATADNRFICYGILWTMRYKLRESKYFKEFGNRLIGKQSASPTPHSTDDKAELRQAETEEKNSRGHVMISYQWDNQELVTKIRDRIKGHNEKVWMDIDDMEGSTLQAMAEAVEQADVVLICMSRKYKDSPNCRAEAEYAHKLEKKVIPLLMEKGYHADGWLGMILGAKLYYDFSGKYPFESTMEGLLKGIHHNMHGGEKKLILQAIPPSYDDVDGPHDKGLYVPCKHPVPKPIQVKKWSTKHLKNWITKHELIGTGAEKLTGKEIAFLQTLQATALEFYYKTLKSDVGLNTLTEMANFKEAMDDLPQNPTFI